ncbi:MAG: hypothetical protein SFT68_05215 [Rickettsiaceae bacterium]|nr:hypothetical protein [Rickettsiaceae bacterium]
MKNFFESLIQYLKSPIFIEKIKYYFIRLSVTVVIIGILAYPYFIITKLYNEVNSLSPFEKAMLLLESSKSPALSNEKMIKDPQIYEKMDAFLRLIYIYGGFEPNKIWASILKLYDPINARKIYLESIEDFFNCSATGSDITKFQASSLRKKLFKKTTMTTTDVADWILVISKHLDSQDKSSDGQNDVLKAANSMNVFYESSEKIGMIKSVKPSMYEYDALWITGGPRISVIVKIIDFVQLYQNNNIKVISDVMAITTNRTLSPQIDGVNQDTLEEFNNALTSGKAIENISISVEDENSQKSIQEGKAYITNLAEDSSVKLDPLSPFIVYTDSQAIKPGFILNYDYPNYLPDQAHTLTEDAMFRDMIGQYSKGINKNIQIPSYAQTNENTTDIEPAINYAADILISKIKSGLFLGRTNINVLLLSSNPFIQSHVIIAQKLINQLLQKSGLEKEYKILVEGIGQENKHSPQIIAKEIADLILNKYIASSIQTQRQLDILTQGEKGGIDIIYEIPNESEWLNNLGKKDNMFVLYFTKLLDARP